MINFFNKFFQENYQCQTFFVSDQDRPSVSPDLGLDRPSVSPDLGLNHLQRLLADDKSCHKLGKS